MNVKNNQREKWETSFKRKNIAEKFSNFFKNYVNQLGINRDGAKRNDETVLLKYPVDVAIQKLLSELLTVPKVFEKPMQKLRNYRWLQKRVQYTICIDDFNRKMKDSPRSGRICKCSFNELIIKSM